MEQHESSRSQAGQAVEELKETGQRAAHEAWDQGAKLAHELRDRAGGLAEDGKNRAAQKIGDIGSALDKAAEKLHEEHEDRLGRYMTSAAEALRNASSSLEHKGLGEIRMDLEAAAKRRPEIFLSVALLGGLALGRFLRSSPPQSRPAGDVAPPTEPVMDVPTPSGQVDWKEPGPGPELPGAVGSMPAPSPDVADDPDLGQSQI
jgi:hypothetical protein